MMKFLKSAALLALLSLSSLSQAAGINFNTAPPASVIRVAGGLEWIWAAPCAPQAPSCGAPGAPAGSYPIQGFRMATLTEWANSWANRAALIAAFTAPAGGAVCGSPWLNSQYNHCDYGDMTNGHIFGAAVNNICDPNYFNGCVASTTETFLVRDLQNRVPAPASLVLVLTALGLAGWKRRKA